LAEKNEPEMKNAPQRVRIHLVPRAGIEPARCLQRGILSPVRLPIPPSRRHTADIMSDFAYASNPQRRAIALAQRFDKRIIAIFDSLIRACAHKNNEVRKNS
jgi:hypothetical protein